MLNKIQNVLTILICSCFIFLASCAKNKNLPPSGKIELNAKNIFLIPKVPNSHEFWIELKKVDHKINKNLDLDSFAKDAKAYGYYSKKNKPKAFILVAFQDKVGNRNEQGVIFDIEGFNYNIDSEEVILEGKTDKDLSYWIVSKNLIPESIELFFE